MGRNLRIDYRWASNDEARLRSYAAELVAAGASIRTASAASCRTASIWPTPTGGRRRTSISFSRAQNRASCRCSSLGQVRARRQSQGRESAFSSSPEPFLQRADKVIE
jgi:hypothetical protein